MLGSIYVGLSGLNAYSRGLQRISSNVSNLNSTGFKVGIVQFSNVEGKMSSGGLSYSLLGANTGKGVKLGDVRLDFKPGELRQTDRDLDLSIDGEGFLTLLRDGETRYLRTGSFEVDSQGYVVLGGTEWRLATLDQTGRPIAVSIDSLRTDAPEATTKVRFADNLSSTVSSYSIGDVKVYDASGAEHLWQIAFTRQETSTDWTVKVSDGTGRTIGEQTLAFANGKPTAETAALTFADSENELSIILDFSSDVSSFSSGSVSTLRAAEVDGHGVGAIATLAVNDKGELEIGYSNDEKRVVGSVAIASFRDLQSLSLETGGLFQDPGNAGRILTNGQDPRVGTVLSRRLEASNVDLSSQFGDLILIQRGYQASSQIVSVANDMIQQLFGIRGQG